MSSPHGDLRDVAPLADALGVVGVDGAVFPFGGIGGEGFGIDVVGAGVDGGQGEGAGTAVQLDFEGFVAVLGPEDFDLAAVDAQSKGVPRKVIELAIGESDGGDNLADASERMESNRNVFGNQEGELIKFGTAVREG